MLTAEQRRSRASLASLASRARKDPAAAEAVDEARREYRYISAAEYVRQLLTATPPLTDAQRDDLARLLRGEAR
jgi:hypothetical protein